MVGWILRMFGIQMIMKRCRSSSNMDVAWLLLEKLLSLNLGNFLKMTVSVHFLSDGLMDSNYIWYTDVSWRDAGFLISIFFFSSPELKAQVSFSDRPLSGVRLSVRLSVCKLLHFRLLLQNRWTNFNQTWHKSSLGKGDSSLFKGRG
jgi:hypothetical protein